ncbi:site-2 protease family protein [Candidatus Saccharibacteria bacterium]|nr:site-2 protease family protein [Candidatus Saccharibacteria bacterium]
MDIFATLIMYLVILVIALTVHEFSHAWAGHMLGDMTAKNEGRLTLNPVKHIDPFMTLLLPLGLILLGSPVVFGAAKPVPFNPYAVRYGKWGAALVAFAGPASNILMALIIGLYLRFVTVPGLGGKFLLQFVLVNVAFFVFNMIPFPPLDGSRLLYAVSPPALMDVLDKIEQYGLIAVFAFIFIFFRFIDPVFTMIVGSIATSILGQPAF